MYVILFDNKLLIDFVPTVTRQEPYNFITDIFFLAHKAQDLGFRVCNEKFMKLNQVNKTSLFIVLILAENFAETFLDGFCLPFPTQVEFTETTKLKEYEASCQCDQ